MTQDKATMNHQGRISNSHSDERQTPPPSFSSVAMTKTFQHLKQWQPTHIVAALSLESVRIVSRYKVHKRLKTAVALRSVAQYVCTIRVTETSSQISPLF